MHPFLLHFKIAAVEDNFRLWLARQLFTVSGRRVSTCPAVCKEC